MNHVNELSPEMLEKLRELPIDKRRMDPELLKELLEKYRERKNKDNVNAYLDAALTESDKEDRRQEYLEKLRRSIGFIPGTLEEEAKTLPTIPKESAQEAAQQEKTTTSNPSNVFNGKITAEQLAKLYKIIHKLE